jgi:hypothetical protein
MRDLREVLLDVRPSLADVDNEVLLELSYLVWAPAMGKRKHAEDPSFCYLPARELEAYFGRGEFNRLNLTHHIFEVLETDTPRCTRGYRVAPDIKAAVDSYLRRVDERLPQLVTRDGTRILTAPRAVASENSEGRASKAWAGAPITNLVQVTNFDLLVSYSAHLRRYLSTSGRLVAGALVPFSKGELRAIAYRDEILTRLIGLCNSNLGGRTHIPHRYEEKDCGRLHAVGVNLQSAPSEIKAAALHGCWEYDFSNCHYSILLQLAQQVGIDLPEVRWYLENKDALRESLAARIGTDDVDAVKTCLISGPLYGAHSRLSERAAITQLLGREPARKLFQDPQYRALKRDVARARGRIIRSARVEQGRMFNAVGSSISLRDPKPRRNGKPRRRSPAALLSHLLLGIEALMLRTIIDAYPEDVVLPMHDGWVSRRRLDVVALERLILDKTGFAMRIEEEQIELPDERTNYDSTSFGKLFKRNPMRGLRNPEIDAH